MLNKKEGINLKSEICKFQNLIATHYSNSMIISNNWLCKKKKKKNGDKKFNQIQSFSSFIYQTKKKSDKWIYAVTLKWYGRISRPKHYFSNFYLSTAISLLSKFKR